MNQTEFKNGEGGRTQAEKIFTRLQQTPGEWVPMPELHRVSGAFAVHSRISDLRTKEGHNIERKTTREKGSRTIHSFYRLITP